jgi:hypothetical protein
VPRITVEPLDVLDGAAWDFRTGEPTWNHPLFGAGRAHWDPFPAYPHDIGAAQTAAAAVERVCPPLWDVHLFAADREDTGRTNGFSYLHSRDRYDPDTGDWVKTAPAGLIMLGGKRLPPHPAVTAYLVGHEYGHHVEWMINQARGARRANDETTAHQYQETRCLPPSVLHHGAGGTWHDAIAEIIACDFRVLVCGIETGYWPHPTIPRPEHVPGLASWWDQALGDVATARAQPAAA